MLRFPQPFPEINAILISHPICHLSTFIEAALLLTVSHVVQRCITIRVISMMVVVVGGGG